jgi:hypothetical protein
MTSERDADTNQQHENKIPSKVKLMVCHQFPGIEMVSPTHASHGATCRLPLDQKVDAGSTIQADFNIHLDYKRSIGVLMYELRRKKADQSNVDGISNEETKCIQFVIIWSINSSKGFSAASCLIERDKGYVWRRNKLKGLVKYCRLYDIQEDPIEETWLIHDNVALMTSLNITCEEECYKLDMTISETNVKDDTQRPWYIGANR